MAKPKVFEIEVTQEFNVNYYVKADSKEEAWELLMNGEYDECGDQITRGYYL